MDVFNHLQNQKDDDWMNLGVAMCFTLIIIVATRNISAIWIKVALLNSSWAHQPNFDWQILYCLGSAGKAAAHNYYRLIQLFKNISLVDIGVTIATQQWRHGFWKRAFLSISRPKLLKRLNVIYSLHIGMEFSRLLGLKWIEHAGMTYMYIQKHTNM